jgi:hypothetical protein
MLITGAVHTDIGVHAFGYDTAMVVTIGLWLALAPAIGAIAIARGPGNPYGPIVLGVDGSVPADAAARFVADRDHSVLDDITLGSLSQHQLHRSVGLLVVVPHLRRASP